MKFKDLKKSLALKAEPIYLVSGEDAFFVERSYKLIVDACVKEPDFNLTVFDGSDLKDNTETLINALMSYPFLSDKRVVAVKEYYPLAREIAELKGYFENPLESTVFVILNTQKSDNLSKQKNVCVVDCSKGDYSLLSGWILNEAKKAGVTFAQSAVNRLIDYCQSDMTKISGETEKLIAYAADSGEVSEEDVFKICVKEEEFELFEAVDCIAFKRYDKAYEILTDMLQSVGDGQKLFAALYGYFRRLFYVSVSNMSLSDMAKSLKVQEYAVKKAKEQSKYFSPKRLKEIVYKLGEYDVAFKSGTLLQQDATWNGILNVLIY